MRPGDTLVVWRLDRLGRSLRHLIDTLLELDRRGAGFKSLTESVDTTTPGGKLIFHIFDALAEFERELIRERTNASLTAARTRGGHPRVKAFTQPRNLELARTLYADKKTPIDDICRQFAVSRATLYRYLGGKRLASNGSAPLKES